MTPRTYAKGLNVDVSIGGQHHDFDLAAPANLRFRARQDRLDLAIFESDQLEPALANPNTESTDFAGIRAVKSCVENKGHIDATPAPRRETPADEPPTRGGSNKRHGGITSRLLFKTLGRYLQALGRRDCLPSAV